MDAAWGDFRTGVVEVLAAVPANIPFGLLVGIAAVDAGLDPVETLAMTVLLFAGVAQLAAIDLLGEAAPAAVVVLTAVVINLRYLMYSASLAPYFKDEPVRWRWFVAYLLIDVTYALSVNRYRREPDRSRRWYYLGTAAPLWVTWVGSVTVGVLVGARVPASWQLDFAVPLLFLALLVPTLEDGRTVVAAAAAGAVATAGVGLPFNAGLMVGATTGIGAGLVAGRWWT